MYPETGKDLRSYYGAVSLAMMAATVGIELMVLLHSLFYEYVDLPIMYSDWYEVIVTSTVVYPAGMLAFGLLLRRFPTPKLVGEVKPGPVQIAQGIAVALGILYASSILTEMLLEDTNTYDYANEAISEEPLAVALVGSVILAPVFEELLFRKLLMDRLLFLGDWSALILSSLFFGLFHTNLYQFLYATGVGLVLGYIRLMTGKMRWNIGLHMFINLFCGRLVGYLPDEEWVWEIFNLAIFALIFYTVFLLIQKKPWRRLYSGPMTYFTGGDKLNACLTSVSFWICVVGHLFLSIVYIIQ